MNRRFALLAFGSALFGVGLGPAFAASDSKFEQAAFDAAKASGKSIILHVAATWCETCQAQRAVLDKLEKYPAFKDTLIITIDFDIQKDVMRSFKVTSRSTLIAFKGATEVGRLTGNTRMAAIKALLLKAV